MAVPYGEKLIPALKAAGLIDDPNRVRRVVIDIDASNVPVVYVEHYGDERLADVLLSLEGIQVERRPPGANLTHEPGVGVGGEV